MTLKELIKALSKIKLDENEDYQVEVSITGSTWHHLYKLEGIALDQIGSEEAKCLLIAQR